MINPLSLLLLLAVSVAGRAEPLDAAPHATDRLTFAGAEYLHRWSQADQHEYTPAGQEDLEHWTDMVTLHLYRTAKEGEALASVANAVLENYRRAGARVLRVQSLPRTPEKPAEYFLSVLFGRPDFIEVTFARFKLVDGLGRAMIYSHRVYGRRAGEPMSAWLREHGAATQQALMALEPRPVPQNRPQPAESPAAAAPQ